MRYKAIGLAVDYTAVKPATNYDAYEGEKHTFGKEKIPSNMFQFKLSFTQ